jgi:3-oxoacyl-[acyl-carrier-protein] synthase-1
LSLPLIKNLVPHGGTMLLLDQVLSADQDSLSARVTITPDSLFCDGAAVGAWVGIEYMAQAVAAHAGYCARLRGEPVKVGFLLGSRRYQVACARFEIGQSLTVRVRRALQSESGLAAFECRIDGDDDGAADAQALASATVTVYQPAAVEEFLQRSQTIEADD